MRHKEASTSILDNVRGPAVGAADDRFGVCHGLQKHDPKTLSAAWHCEYRAAPVPLQKCLVPYSAEEVRPAMGATLAGEVFQVRTVISFTHNNQTCVGNRSQEPWQSLDERIHPLVALAVG